MRGRTLNDSFVILDEAQNTTSEQMKMFLTRLGFNSKAVITGDITQVDLPAGKKSGLVEALEVCGKIEAIRIGAVSARKDVVRHNLVQQIIRAYEEYDGSQPHRSFGGGNGKTEPRAESGKAQVKRISGVRMILNRQRAVRVARRPLELFLTRVQEALGLEKADITICSRRRFGDRADE